MSANLNRTHPSLAPNDPRQDFLNYRDAWSELAFLRADLAKTRDSRQIRRIRRRILRTVRALELFRAHGPSVNPA